jgi:hypothetical protein
LSKAFGMNYILKVQREKEIFDELVAQCDTTEADQKIATSEKIFAEKHTVPSEFEVIRISTRKKVEFNK